MRHCRSVARLIVMLLTTSIAMPASAGQSSSTERTPRNTLEFDHLRLRGVTDDPVALEIGDGDLFQVVVTNTDPRLFKYTISATQDETLPSSSLAADATPVTARIDGRANLTMRHDRHFSRYRVTISALPGVIPERVATVIGGTGNRPSVAGGTKTTEPAGEFETAALYPVSFDVWVLTRPEWKVSISGGVAFSGLTDRKFFIKTAADGAKTVEEDVAARDSTRQDIVALANVYFDHQFKRGLMLGAAFGIGQNSGGAPRYYVGPSVVLGRNFVFSGGIAFGSVAAPPVGQSLGRAPVNGDNTLTSLGSRFGRGGFFSLAFTFVNKDAEFKNAFSSTTTTTGEGIAALSIADLEGDYVEGTAVKATVKATKADGKARLPLTVTFADKTTVELTDTNGVWHYASKDGKKEAKFSGKKGDLTLQYLEDGAVKMTLKKKAA